MSGPTKAAPREKQVESGPDLYRVKHTSYINGSLQHRGAVVQLPKGVRAGSNLELIKKDKSASDGGDK